MTLASPILTASGFIVMHMLEIIHSTIENVDKNEKDVSELSNVEWDPREERREIARIRQEISTDSQGP